MRSCLPVFLLCLLLPGGMILRTAHASGATKRGALVNTPANCPPQTPTPLLGEYDHQGPFMRNDTLFLRDRQHRNPLDGQVNYCRVYIAPADDGTSLRGAASLDSEHNRRDWEQNLRNLQKRDPGPLTAFDQHECPCVWLPVVSFQGVFYVDTYFGGPIWLSDSLFIHRGQDGPWPSPLESVERPEKNHWQLHLTAAYSDPAQVDIYLLDTIHRIALFVFGDKQGNSLYRQLYTPLDAALQLDRVVWDCSEIPDRHEVTWDTIDSKTHSNSARQKQPLKTNKNGTERP